MKKTKLAMILLAAFGTVSVANAATSSHQYSLKGDAPTGTKLQSTIATSAVPFDKRYFELNDSEKATFRAQYDQLATTVIPPFPRAGMQAIYKPIIEAQQKSTSRGNLSLKVVVDENGRVEDLSVAESPNRHLAKASADILRRTQFDPAFCAGVPCKMEFPVEIKFQ